MLTDFFPAKITNFDKIQSPECPQSVKYPARGVSTVCDGEIRLNAFRRPTIPPKQYIIIIIIIFIIRPYQRFLSRHQRQVFVFFVCLFVFGVFLIPFALLTVLFKLKIIVMFGSRVLWDIAIASFVCKGWNYYLSGF